MVMRVQVTLPASSNVPADDIVNTWSLLGAEITPSVGEAITAAFQGFYTSWGGWINGTVSRVSPASLEVYNLSDPEPRSPVYINEIILPAAGAGALPREVAICTSFRGNYPSGVSRARRRGRVYMGPLIQNASTGAGLPTNAMCEALANATEQLVEDLAAIEGGTSALGVHSRVGGGITPVIAGWVDTAFDTQRRRGQPSSFRYVWAT